MRTSAVYVTPGDKFPFCVNQVSKENCVKGSLQKFPVIFEIFEIPKPSENILKNKVTFFVFFCFFLYVDIKAFSRCDRNLKICYSYLLWCVLL